MPVITEGYISMDKTFLATTILFSALCTYSATFSMISSTTLGHNDIRQHICLCPEDKDDFRLVCRDWARKNSYWKVMPDSVEKEYDKIIKKKRVMSSVDQTLILYSRAADNDYNAIEWITRYSNKKILQGKLKMHGKYIGECLINSAMLAIHNKNREMAELLINANESYKDKTWKTYYKTITIQDRLGSHDRDFSFIPYMIAIILDNNDKLRALLLRTMPNPEIQTTSPNQSGIEILLELSMIYNAADCLDTLLYNAPAQKIIKKDRMFFFTTAINHYAQAAAQKLINYNLFSINTIFKNKTTILDCYLHDNKYKKDTKIHAILRALGAKTYKELNICVIQ